MSRKHILFTLCWLLLCCVVLPLRSPLQVSNETIPTLKITSPIFEAGQQEVQLLPFDVVQTVHYKIQQQQLEVKKVAQVKEKFFRKQKVSSLISQAIVNASDEFNIPTDLMVSQAMQESDFNPQMTGSNGDIGLFQILPETAYDINNMYFKIHGFSPDMLYNPVLNAQFAGCYLKYLHSLTHSWESSLTAYNMGLGGYYQHGSYSYYYERVNFRHCEIYGTSL